MASSSQQSNLASSFLQDLERKYAHQPTFLQAVEEMATSLQPLFLDPDKGKLYQRAFLLLAEPERVVSFRVPWTDDSGTLQISRGWRVEFSSALGPYKGGLRFHKSVDEGILKFLGFEQIFKNALTGLPLGGGKGGSDFDPKNKSPAEIKRFCQSFMTELYRHIGPSRDVPAGDIGVGGREIGYLTGQYKRLTNQHGEGILTGKPFNIGGSLIRPEATGYGLVYIAKLAIQDKRNEGLAGANCAISGSGNVAQYAAQKLLEYGSNVVTISDSNGALYFENGMTLEDWKVIIQAKQVDRLRLSQIEGRVTGVYVAGASPWTLGKRYDYAIPCATQNEIDSNSITQMAKDGLKGLFEGANLPTNLEAQNVLKNAPHIIYIPGKAANAGGVGVSGFEMSQNAQKLTWKPELVDEKLQDLMANIYDQLVNSAGNSGTLETGANQAGFLRVVKALEDLGWL